MRSELNRGKGKEMVQNMVLILDANPEHAASFRRENYPICDFFRSSAYTGQNTEIAPY